MFAKTSCTPSSGCPRGCRDPALQLLLLACISIYLVGANGHEHGHVHGSGHECVHDHIERPTLDDTTRSRILYNIDAGKKRRLRDEADDARRLATTSINTTRAPLRIHAEYVKTDGSAGSDSTDTDLVNHIKNSLMPQAIDFWAETLYTYSVKGPLRFDRHCADAVDMSQYGGPDYVCYKTYDPERCSNLDSNSVVIPSEWLNVYSEVCTECYADGSCSGCADQPTAGPGDGLVDTDFALLVTIANTDICSEASGRTLGYAYTCRWDQWDRPILGYMNLCPGAMSLDSVSDELKLLTMKHELAHSLGFNARGFAHMRERDGKTPRTPREGGGLTGSVPQTQIKCHDGNQYLVRAPGSSTLWRGRIESREIDPAFKLATPTVIAAGRQFFGCDTLNGVELENTPTTSGACFGSHWEQRVLNSEAMAAVVTDSSSAFSAITLAAFHDMGFYSVDFSKSDSNMVWGNRKGCSFLQNKCVSSGTAMLQTEGYFCRNVDKNQLKRCSYDRLAQSTCKSSVGTLGDCPMFVKDQTGYCSNADPGIQNSANHAGERYGTESKCIEGSLIRNSAPTQGDWNVDQINPACYEISCGVDPNGRRYAKVFANASNGSIASTTCFLGDEGQRRSMDHSFKGTLVCPNVDLVCATGIYATGFELTCEKPSDPVDGYNLDGEEGSRGIESFNVSGGILYLTLQPLENSTFPACTLPDSQASSSAVLPK